MIASEHIGHQVVTSKIIGRDLLKDPGLHRSLFGDNFSTMLSGLIGSVPTTTYGENIGVMAVTKVYSVRVIAGAAILSIICSFVGKLSTLISTIPGPVIGGISFLLYGMIGTSGLRILVDAKVDYSKNRNQALTSVIFVTGLSGAALKIGNIELTGMVLACVVGMALSLVFYVLDRMHLTNESGGLRQIKKSPPRRLQPHRDGLSCGHALGRYQAVQGPGYAHRLYPRPAGLRRRPGGSCRWGKRRGCLSSG